jgi:hypothetical protein
MTFAILLFHHEELAAAPTLIAFAAALLPIAGWAIYNRYALIACSLFGHREAVAPALDLRYCERCNRTVGVNDAL